MLEQLRQVSFLIAALRQTALEITHENEELRKRYTQLQNEYEICKNEYDKLKNEYAEYKRNIEKTSQEIPNDGA